MRHFKNILILFVCFFCATAQAQLHICGAPTFVPKQRASHFAKDSCAGGGMYEYKKPQSKWYREGTIISASAPLFIFPSGATTVDNTSCIWQNANSTKFIAVFKNSAWAWDTLKTSGDINLNPADFVRVTTNQTIDDVKRFNDTIKAKGGIYAEASATRPAIHTIGVQSREKLIVTSDRVLDGAYGYLDIRCSTTDITLILPPVATTKGWFYEADRQDDLGEGRPSGTPLYVIFERPDGSFKRILNKGFWVIRNKGTNWDFDF